MDRKAPVECHKCKGTNCTREIVEDFLDDDRRIVWRCRDCGAEWEEPMPKDREGA